MAGGLSITAADLRRLHAVTDPDQLGRPGEPLPGSLLQGLADLIGCDNVVYEFHDLAAQLITNHQRLVDVDGTKNFSTQEVQKSFWRLYHQGLCDYWLRTGDYSSVRQMLHEPNWQEWGHTPYAECMRSLGVRGEITIAFPPHAGNEYRLLLWRYSGRDFTERDGLLLTLIRPHLVELQRRANHRTGEAVDLTPRQRELLRLMAAGMTNRQIATRLRISEGTVRTHSENIFRQLHVNNRVAAIAKVPADER
jgi:DNA-binding CsgD family transcriptional regulator